jgi:hypothetical protein
MVDSLENSVDWILQGKVVQGQLISCIRERVAEHIRDGHYSADEVGYIAAIDEMPVKGTVDISSERLEKLRRLCQVWEVDLRYNNITSHRFLIGPIIVAIKKIFYPVIRAIFKDYIRQQKEFNAATIALLADLSNEGKLK